MELLRLLETKATEWREQNQTDGNMKIGAAGQDGSKKTKSQKKKEAEIRRQAASMIEQYKAGTAAAGFRSGKAGKQKGGYTQPPVDNKFDAQGNPLCNNCGGAGHK